MKKTVFFVFICLMILGILGSCDASSGSKGNGDGQKTGNNNPNDERILPDLPDADFENYEFTFLTHLCPNDDWFSPEPREIVAEIESTADPINSAVYERNDILSRRYNITFKMVADENEHTVLSNLVNADDDIYDAVIIYNNNIQTVSSGNLLTNIENLKYVDLEKPWWDPAANSMSIDNKQFLLAGDMLILDNEATNAMIFNKALMINNGLAFPYALVKEGKWTMDEMNRYVKDAAQDLDGDSKITPEEDLWGFVCFRDTLHALLVSGGGTLALKDQDDLPYMNIMDPRNLAVIDKAMDIMYNKQDVMNIQVDTVMGTNTENWLRVYHNVFQESRALFMWVRMRVVEKFRGMDAEFGIIPLPKYDELQENYHSVVNPYTGVMLGVPRNVKNFDRTSIILEALAAESRYTLQPAYYEVVLQRKIARDSESQEMLDIIFDSRVYDIGAIYGFGDAFIGFVGLCDKYDRNMTSFYDKRHGAMERAITKVVEAFSEME